MLLLYLQLILQWCNREILISNYKLLNTDVSKTDDLLRSLKIDDNMSSSIGCRTVWTGKFEKDNEWNKLTIYNSKYLIYVNYFNIDASEDNMKKNKNERIIFFSLVFSHLKYNFFFYDYIMITTFFLFASLYYNSTSMWFCSHHCLWNNRNKKLDRY